MTPETGIPLIILEVNTVFCYYPDDGDRVSL